MKTQSVLHFGAVVALCTALTAETFAQSTAFTYQGRLTDANGAADGVFDFRFVLFDAGLGGNQAGETMTNESVTVSAGLFTTMIEPAEEVLDGTPLWLEIAVRPADDTGEFVLLDPRQPLGTAPYAIRALESASANAVAWADVTDVPEDFADGIDSDTTYDAGTGLELNDTTFSIAPGGVDTTLLSDGGVTTSKLADGAVLGQLLEDDGSGSGLDADLLDGLHAAAFWQIGGNTGTSPGSDFLGTKDNQPLEFKVNGLRALRLEDNGDSASDDGTIPDGAPNVIGGSPLNFVAAGIVGATISGGGATNFFNLPFPNSVSADFGTVGGGFRNSARSFATTVGGGEGNTIVSNSPYATIGGGLFHNIRVDSNSSTVGGGFDNNIGPRASYATIAGGFLNQIVTNASWSSIGGGHENLITNEVQYGTISGGALNVIGVNADASAIGGGFVNRILEAAQYAVISGGRGNVVGTNASYAFAAGRRAQSIHPGAFVWADATDENFTSTAGNQFNIRASGGVRLSDTTTNLLFDGAALNQKLHLLGTGYGIGVQTDTLYFRSDNDFSWHRQGSHHDGRNNPGEGTELMRLSTSGLAVNGTFVSSSDRNLKEHLEPVDPRAVLEKVAALPLREWSYLTDDGGSRHLGPMAQDFHAAFGLGADDRHIAMVDADGVALAAIQGLNQKLEETMGEQQSRIRELESMNAGLQRRLEALERRLKSPDTQ